MPLSIALELQNVTKRYGNTFALSGVSLEFEEGLYGVLGANGAGKSTLLNLLTDNITRDSGSILLNGEEILKLGASYRNMLGFMPQEQGFFEQMTAWTFLFYIARLKGLSHRKTKSQIYDLLEAMNLSDKCHKKVSSLSGGMRQRLLLAQALLGDPRLLILDEPTAGLDPNERIKIRNYISSIARGKIVIIATHIVSDLEMVSDKIVLLKSGQIIGCASPKEWVSKLQGKVLIVASQSLGLAESQVNFTDTIAGCRVVSVFRREGCTMLRLVGDPVAQGEVVPRDQFSLEDVFMFYAG